MLLPERNNNASSLRRTHAPTQALPSTTEEVDDRAAEERRPSNMQRFLFPHNNFRHCLAVALAFASLATLQRFFPISMQQTKCAGGSCETRATQMDEVVKSDAAAHILNTACDKTSRFTNLTGVTLNLIGERHSGTNWIGKHLEECFGDCVVVEAAASRWKHWMQSRQGPSSQYMGENAVVVAQFRNAYDWTAAMHKLPYHAPEHFHLEWYDFVTKPWTMPRYGRDLELQGKLTRADYVVSNDTTLCTTVHGFKPYQIIPCLETHGVHIPSTRDQIIKPRYELRQDGSGKPFANILAMRRAKIRNFMRFGKVSKRIKRYVPVRYEDLVKQGTAGLLQDLETALGVYAACEPVSGRPLQRRPMPPEFFDHLRSHVDWKTEAMVGYKVNATF